MVTASAGLRVGAIDFLNCFPLTWGLEASGALDQLNVTSDTPDRLSDALVRGDLDLGPISAIEALRHASELYVLSQPAVVADGPAGSVSLITKVPVDQLSGRRIALGSTSRTSVVLARLLLEQRYRVEAEYFTAEPDLDAMLRQSDAAVLIGDPALQATLRGGGTDWQILDLAESWRSWTGLPMVFAVWAVRRDVAADEPQRVLGVQRAMCDALRLAARHPEAVARAAAQRSGFAPNALRDYFAGLTFALDRRSMDGLDRFAELAEGIGELPTGGRRPRVLLLDEAIAR